MSAKKVGKLGDCKDKNYPSRIAYSGIFTSVMCLCGKLTLIKRKAKYNEVFNCERCGRIWKLDVKEV